MDVKLFFNKPNLKIRIAVTVMSQYTFQTQIPVMNEFPNLTSKKTEHSNANKEVKLADHGYYSPHDNNKGKG